MKRSLILSLALAAWSVSAFAGFISSSNVVTTTQRSGPYGALTSTFSYNVPSGTNRCLVVFANVGVVSGAYPSVSSVTYGGVPLTRAVSKTQQEQGFFYYTDSEIWYLVNPAAGVSQNIVISGAAWDAVANGAVTLYNVNPFTPLGQTGSNGSSADGSVALSVPLSNLKLESWILSDIGHLSDGTNTPTSNISGTFFTHSAFLAGEGERAGAGYTEVDNTSETVSWSYHKASNIRGALVAAEFLAIPEPGSFLLLLSGAAGVLMVRRQGRPAR
ncbi:MAG: PEP-CTERM sorting domain-containing protein [Verrucomicrobia bacterium]|nr:PEP-CTERM sorting domain-containing protein [Verrucomicrobiota bacterium]